VPAQGRGPPEEVFHWSRNRVWKYGQSLKAMAIIRMHIRRKLYDSTCRFGIVWIFLISTLFPYTQHIVSNSHSILEPYIEMQCISS
jgi:hypothetical protein